MTKTSKDKSNYAMKGNKNALKHGLYAKREAGPKSAEDAAEADGNRDERAEAGGNAGDADRENPSGERPGNMGATDVRAGEKLQLDLQRLPDDGVPERKPDTDGRGAGRIEDAGFR